MADKYYEAQEARMLDALSICLIVKNEAVNLPVCLESVRGLASELIVVDTGSSDETPRIATTCGAQVIFFDFSYPDFSAARNYALGWATGRWILMLDADETLAPGDAARIGELVARNENAGYFFERHNLMSPGETTHVDHVVRMFPNRPDIRFRGRVHETVDAAILAGGGRLLKTGIRLHHTFSSRDPQSRRRKNLWYLEILQEEIKADPANTSRLDFLAAEYHQLGMHQQAMETTERIARLRPRDAQAHLFVGVYHLMHKNDLTQARADFETALHLRPGYPEAESFLQTVHERENAGQQVA